MAVVGKKKWQMEDSLQGAQKPAGGTQSAMIGGGASGATPASVKPVGASTGGGGRFTNVQRYLDANKGAGGNIAKTVGGYTEKKASETEKEGEDVSAIDKYTEDQASSIAENAGMVTDSVNNLSTSSVPPAEAPVPVEGEPAPAPTPGETINQFLVNPYADGKTEEELYADARNEMAEFGGSLGSTADLITGLGGEQGRMNAIRQANAGKIGAYQGGYSPGMAALSGTLLMSDPEGAAALGDLQTNMGSRLKAIQSLYDKYADTPENEGSIYDLIGGFGDKVSEAQQGVFDALRDKVTGYEGSIIARAEEENALRDKQRSAIRDYLSGNPIKDPEMAAWAAEQMGALGYSTGSGKNFGGSTTDYGLIDNKGVDYVMQELGLGGDYNNYVEAKDMTTQTDVDYLNYLNSLTEGYDGGPDNTISLDPRFTQARDEGSPFDSGINIDKNVWDQMLNEQRDLTFGRSLSGSGSGSVGMDGGNVMSTITNQGQGTSAQTRNINTTVNDVMDQARASGVFGDLNDDQMYAALTNMTPEQQNAFIDYLMRGKSNKNTANTRASNAATRAAWNNILAQLSGGGEKVEPSGPRQTTADDIFRENKEERKKEYS